MELHRVRGMTQCVKDMCTRFACRHIHVAYITRSINVFSFYRIAGKFSRDPIFAEEPSAKISRLIFVDCCFRIENAC